MNELSVAQVLRRAVDVLAERGWHQGDIEGPNGERCAYGAILAAKYEQGDKNRHAPGLFFENWLHAQGVLDSNLGVGVWNDDPSRSYEDVVLALKLAAADADVVAGVVAPPNAHTEPEG